MKSEEKENKKRYSVIENETGEIITQQDRVYWRTEKQDKAWQEVKEKTQCDKLFKEYQTEVLGGFVFMIYDNVDILTNQLKIPIQDLPKLVYLSTFLNYDNVICEGKIPMTKAQMQEKLGIAKPAFNKLFKLLIETKILNESKNGKEKIYRLNEEILRKGQTDTDKIKTKMYINSVRYLYENTSVRMHKNLAIVYQLIPYVHKDTNMICKNPFEEVEKLIVPLNINEIAVAMGFSIEGDNIKNISRIKKSILNLTLKDGTSVMVYFKVNDTKKERWFLNPRVISNFVSSEQYDKFYMAERWAFMDYPDN